MRNTAALTVIGVPDVARSPSLSTPRNVAYRAGPFPFGSNGQTGAMPRFFGGRQ